MIRLNSLDVPREPYWIDLSYGVRLFVRPLTTAVYSAARSAASKFIRELMESSKDMEGAGLEVLGMPDVNNEHEVHGFSQMLFTQSLAQSAIIEWEGVLAPEGDEPAPVEDDFVNALIRDVPKLAEEFLIEYTLPQEQMIVEGEPSPSGQNGTSPEGSSTAETVEPTTPPAAEESPDSTESSVPISDTNQEQ